MKIRKKNRTRGVKMSFGGGSSGGSVQSTGVQPYAAAEPALNKDRDWETPSNIGE